MNHKNNNNLTEDEIMERDDLGNRLAVLKEFYKNFNEPGMILVCIPTLHIQFIMMFN